MIRALLFLLVIFSMIVTLWITARFIVFLFFISVIGFFMNIAYFRGVFIVFDQFANALYYPLLNLIFKNPKFKFGNPDETISSVLGKNILYCPEQCDKSIFIVDKFLSKIDPQKGSHSKRSIEEDENA